MAYQALAARHRRLAHLAARRGHRLLGRGRHDARRRRRDAGPRRWPPCGCSPTSWPPIPRWATLLEAAEAEAAARRADRMGSGQRARDEARLRARDGAAGGAGRRPARWPSRAASRPGAACARPTTGPGMMPLLAEVVARKREVAAALADRLGLAPYDALLDGFEPGARSARRSTPLFAELRAFLPGFIARALERQRGEPVLAPRGAVPGRAAALAGPGGDEAGRLRLRARPPRRQPPPVLRRGARATCASPPATTRPTSPSRSWRCCTRPATPNTSRTCPAPGWTSRWAGRAAWACTRARACSRRCRSAAAASSWSSCAPLVREAFPEAAARAARRRSPPRTSTAATPGCSPDFIRVDADEATYPCHVLLRYDLERQLIAGTLPLAELPEAWDAGMRSLLGLSHRRRPPATAACRTCTGPPGLFGYFPTYTLGALVAAQLFAAARRALPELPAQIARGEFDPLNALAARRGLVARLPAGDRGPGAGGHGRAHRHRGVRRPPAGALSVVASR